MASPQKIHILGKFDFGGQGEVKKFLGKFEQLIVLDKHDEMDMLLLADADHEKKRAALDAAKDKGLPIIREEWLRELVKQDAWVEPASYKISQIKTEPGLEDKPDEAAGQKQKEERQEKEHQEKERQEKERQEKERQEKERQEKERQEKEHQEKERQEKEHQKEDVDTPVKKGDPSNQDHPRSGDISLAELTSDRYRGRELPEWAQITRDGSKQIGVIECIVAGGQLLVSEEGPDGRRGYLLSSRVYATAKSEFIQNYNLMLHTESVETWLKKRREGKSLTLGQDLHIEFVAQSPSKTVVILFEKGQRKPLLFTATMIKSIWNAKGHNMLKEVMQKVGQGPFLARSDFGLSDDTNMSAQAVYMEDRAQSILRESQEREHRHGKSGGARGGSPIIQIQVHQDLDPRSPEEELAVLIANADTLTPEKYQQKLTSIMGRLTPDAFKACFPTRR